MAEEGVGSRACETPCAPPGSTSSGSEQTRHKGGSRRSCQSEALPVTGVAPPPPPPPLSLRLSTRPLSVSGLWCSAGGGGGGGGATEPHCACAPAAPPGPAPRSQASCRGARPWRGVSHPSGPGQGGARVGRAAWVPLLTHASLPHVDGVAVCASGLGEGGGHIFCLTSANATLGSGWKAWRTSCRCCR